MSFPKGFHIHSSKKISICWDIPNVCIVWNLCICKEISVDCDWVVKMKNKFCKYLGRSLDHKASWWRYCL